jgi:glucosamine--fructose-6-phosphate aminotransferase (isomerizing)
MCGIVGYIGERSAAPILLDGLKRLEYRGYDSAGIAILTSDRRLEIHKREGKLARLMAHFNGSTPTGQLGIGHTRWATHGAPTERNAHPHTDCDERIIIVHNGIIENYASLRDELIAGGHKFRSETDTEVVAHLIEARYADTRHSEADFLSAVRGALKAVEGAYAIVAFSPEHPDLIVGARLFSPLVAGIGQGENYLASDIPAILRETQQALLIEDGEVVTLRPDSVKITDLDGRPIRRQPFQVTWNAEAAEKGGFQHFVIKEIYEQPESLLSTLRGRLNASRDSPNGRSDFPSANEAGPSLSELNSLDFSHIQRIYIVACGTSFYAGLIGKLAVERWARLPVEVAIASEFRYSQPLLDEHTLVILITQSGETADTLAGFRLARAAGSPTMALTNIVGSSITRDADVVLYLQVGPEIGVVATKTFTAQLTLLSLVALHLGTVRGTLDPSLGWSIEQEIRRLPNKVKALLALDGEIAELARKYRDSQSFFFLGRGFGYPIALEGALKLKEISYIHAEGYPAGELKHGPIAMLDPTIPVIAIATRSATYEKVISNIQEVRARSAHVIALATEGDTEICQHVDHMIYVPKTDEPLSPILNVVPLQLFAYHMAVELGCDVDQPRNLAKSVTVE